MTHLVTVAVDEPETWPAPLALAQVALGRGEVVVLPTDTVYGIGADAFSPQAVARLLAAKGRGRIKPPPVLVGDLATLDALAAEVSDAARALTERFWPGALTIIVPAQPSLTWDLGETHGTVALRMPDHPVALELLRNVGPLAVSSANLTEHPAATTAQEARDQLGDLVAVYIDAGKAPGGVSSTIVDLTAAVPTVVRTGGIDLASLREILPDIVEGAAG